MYRMACSVWQRPINQGSVCVCVFLSITRIQHTWRFLTACSPFIGNIVRDALTASVTVTHYKATLHCIELNKRDLSHGPSNAVVSVCVRVEQKATVVIGPSTKCSSTAIMLGPVRLPTTDTTRSLLLDLLLLHLESQPLVLPPLDTWGVTTEWHQMCPSSSHMMYRSHIRL